MELSEDALIVQTITAALQRAGVTGDVFSTVQRHGYFFEGTQERWINTKVELKQGSLLGQHEMIEYLIP